MSVDFDDPNYGVYSQQGYGQTVGTIEKLVIKTGLAPDPRRARIILAIVFLVVIVTSVITFFMSTGTKTKIQAPPGYKIIYSDDSPPKLEQIQ